jgi:hypothetical protein
MKHRQHFEDTIQAIREGGYRAFMDIIPAPLGNQVEPFSLPTNRLVDRIELAF